MSSSTQNFLPLKNFHACQYDSFLFSQDAKTASLPRQKGSLRNVATELKQLTFLYSYRVEQSSFTKVWLVRSAITSYSYFHWGEQMAKLSLCALTATTILWRVLQERYVSLLLIMLGL